MYSVVGTDRLLLEFCILNMIIIFNVFMSHINSEMLLCFIIMYELLPKEQAAFKNTCVHTLLNSEIFYSAYAAMGAITSI